MDLKGRDRCADALVDPNRRVPSELRTQQIGRTNQPGFIVPAHADSPEAKQRWIRTHRARNAFGEFAHRMPAAGSDVPRGDATLIAAMRVRAQHRLNDVVDIDK